MEIFFLVLLFFLALIILVWQLSNMISIFFGSLYVSANSRLVNEALKKADLKPGEVFYELGCGVGQILVEAEKYGVKAVGFEISPWYFFLAKLRTLGKKNIGVYFKDIRQVDFKGADAIYCYLLPKFLKTLSPKFKKELKKTARLISIGFDVPGLKLIYKNDLGPRKYFIYCV
jgi:SAM-dependent methyltransferase